MDAPGLVADIGGTNARFALVGPDATVESIQVLATAEHRSLAAAVEAYLELSGRERPRQAVFAIAGPIAGDEVRMTNAAWSFSAAAVRDQLGLDGLQLLNDFAALALSLPALGPEHTPLIKAGEAVPGTPLAVLGPGTGLGVGALVPADDGWVPVTGEGGHRDLAAADEREWRIVQRLGAEYGHVSAERVLSGSGLATLYRVIGELEGRPAEALDAAQITHRAATQKCPLCAEAIRIFSGQLGAVAGDLALTLGARGGVFLGGGMVSKMGEEFRVDEFVARFEAKGRFTEYLRRIPVRRIEHPYPGLVGAARALC